MANLPKPGPGARIPLAITIDLGEVYRSLCPACREVLLDYISGKAGAGALRETLRQQFEPPASPEPVEGAPAVDH